MDSNNYVVAKAFCSTANLGPGFDTFGLALDKYFDLVGIRKISKKHVMIRVGGRYGRRVPTDPKGNSAGPPALEMLRMAEPRHGLLITVRKNIPVGVGLGSSGATATACVKALNTMLQLNLPDETLVHLASQGESAVSGASHADNVAASLLGGFTIVYGENPVRVLRLQPPRTLAVVVVTPRIRIAPRKTRFARSVLPREVPLRNAVLNIGRASAFVAGFSLGDLDLVGKGMVDEIVEPHREKLIPGYKAAREAALSAKASGVAISGAGPSVCALVDNSRIRAGTVARAMVSEFRKNGVTSSFFVAKPAPPASIVRKS